MALELPNESDPFRKLNKAKNETRLLYLHPASTELGCKYIGPSKLFDGRTYLRQTLRRHSAPELPMQATYTSSLHHNHLPCDHCGREELREYNRVFAERRTYILSEWIRRAPIVGTVKVVSLDDKPQYEAISYAWGDPSDRLPVWLNGRAVAVPASLCGALQRLRLWNEREERALWADAVCINQQDVEERGEQIRIMDRLFGSAAQVIAWLGHEPSRVLSMRKRIALLGDDDMTESQTNQTFISLLRMEQGFNFPLQEFLKYLASRKTVEQCAEHFRHRVTLRQLQDLLIDFFARPWFHRVWVLQEASLARQVIFVLGFTAPIALELLHNAMTQVSLEIGYMSIKSRIEWAGRMHAGGMIAQIVGWRDFAMRVRWANAAVRTLFTARSLQCTDDRDRVYGLLALTGLGQRVRVDYGEHNTPEDVYFDVARAVLLHEKSKKGVDPNLDLLLAAGLCLNLGASVTVPSSDPDGRRGGIDVDAAAAGLLLPSWVPDWRAADMINSKMRFRTQHLYNASLGTCCRATVNDSDRSLCVKAIPVGEEVESLLLNVAHFVWSNIRESESSGPELEWRYVSNWQKFFHGLPTDTLWRVMLMDVFSFPGANQSLEVRRMSNEDCAWLERRRFPSERKLRVAGAEEVQMSNWVLQCVSAQIPCKTSAGRPASVPWCTRPGDRIYIIPGTNFPWLLRRARDRGERHFRLVGSCYVHGIMDGEAVTAAMERRGVTDAEGVCEEIVIV
jgi:hypothetical protein